MKSLKLSSSEETDVDARFLLANERTLLAWVRTSLAIEAGGAALIEVHKNHTYIGIIVLFLGAIVALVGYHRYQAAGKAIRENRLPPTGIAPAFQVILIVMIAIGLAAAQWTILK